MKNILALYPREERWSPYESEEELFKQCRMDGVAPGTKLTVADDGGIAEYLKRLDELDVFFPDDLDDSISEQVEMCYAEDFNLMDGPEGKILEKKISDAILAIVKLHILKYQPFRTFPVNERKVEFE